MKAVRNARMRLLSEEIKTKIILLAKENSKTRQVTPDDDVPPNGENGQHDETKPVEHGGLSKDILYEELTLYCTDAEGLVDTNLRDSKVSQIATKKDGTPIKSWDELDKIDGEKYEKWFAKMLRKFREDH